MFLKPAPGLKVRDPKTKKHLPEEGKEVSSSSFWLRRLAEGAVVETKPELHDCLEQQSGDSLEE